MNAPRDPQRSFAGVGYSEALRRAAELVPLLRAQKA